MLTIGFWLCIIAGLGFIKDGDVATGFVLLCVAVMIWCKWLANEIEKRKEGP